MTQRRSRSQTQKQSDSKSRYEKKLRDDFAFFFSEISRLDGRMKPITWPQLIFCDILTRGHKRIILNAYREARKSWTVWAWALWRLYKDPEKEKVMLLSASESHPRKALTQMRGWIDIIPFLQHLRPKPGAKSLHRDNAEMFDVGPCTPQAAPSVSIYGATTQYTGNRATIIIPDDMENKDNVVTVNQRERLIDHFTELEFMGKDSEMVVPGTPHHEETVYDKLIARGFLLFSVPVLYPRPEEIDQIPGVAPAILEALAQGKARPGEVVDKLNFSTENIEEYRARSGNTAFERQMMLKRGLIDGLTHPLKQSDLIVFDITRDQAPSTIAWGRSNTSAIEDIPAVGLAGDRLYGPIHVSDKWYDLTGTKAFLDPAGAGKDEMAWAIVGHLHGYLFVKYLGVINGEGPKVTAENLELIAESLRTYGATELVIENQFGGDMIATMMTPILSKLRIEPKDETYPNGWGCYTTTLHATRQKEVRIIETLEPVMNQHRLVVSRQVASDTVLMQQMTLLTSQRHSLEHDDRIDALASAVALWKDNLAQDAAERARQADEDDRRKLLQQYLDDCERDYRGRQPKKADRWHDYSYAYRG